MAMFPRRVSTPKGKPVVIPFISQGPTKGPEQETIVDHGTIGPLQYEIYKRKDRKSVV